MYKKKRLGLAILLTAISLAACQKTADNPTQADPSTPVQEEQAEPDSTADHVSAADKDESWAGRGTSLSDGCTLF